MSVETTLKYFKSNLEEVNQSQEDKLYDLLTNYVDNCSAKEWANLLKKFNVIDQENYMGEVREKLEDAVMGTFEYLEKEEQEKLFKMFKKYELKQEPEQEEELEK